MTDGAGTEFESLGTSSELKSATASGTGTGSASGLGPGTGLASGLGLGTGLGCARELPLSGQEEAKVGHLLGSLLGLGQVVTPLHAVYLSRISPNVMTLTCSDPLHTLYIICIPTNSLTHLDRRWGRIYS